MPATSHTVPLVGAFHRPPALSILRVLPNGHPLMIVPEPDNPYDPNAIKVIVATHTLTSLHPDLIEELSLQLPGQGYTWDDIQSQLFWHLGYIDRDNAAKLHFHLALSLSALTESELIDGLTVSYGWPARLGFTSGKHPYTVTFEV